MSFITVTAAVIRKISYLLNSKVVLLVTYVTEISMNYGVIQCKTKSVLHFFCFVIQLVY